MKATKKNQNTVEVQENDVFNEIDESNSIDNLENAPEDLEELFSEPPL